MFSELSPAQRVVFGAIICIAAYFRLVDLGAAALIDDEYYLARSIQFVTDTGLPQFPNGGYYARGVIQQYMTAALLGFFDKPEAALRLIPALCNLLSLPLVFLIAKRLTNVNVALLAMCLFGISVWEIEFARFARMYAPFQLLFLAYVLLMTKAIVDISNNALYGAFILSVIGIFVYEASAFLLVFNFIPWVMGMRFEFNAKLFVPLIPLILFIAVTLAISPPSLTPPESLGSGGHKGLILVPPFLAITAVNSLLTLIPFVFMVVLAFALVFRVWRLANESLFSQVLLSLIVVLSLLNLYSLCLLLLMLWLILPGESSLASWQLLFQRHKPILLFVVGTFVFWCVYALLNNGWLGVVKTLDVNNYPNKYVQLAGVFFNFPQIIPRYVAPLLQGMPITSLAWFLLVGLGFFHSLTLPQREQNRAYFYVFLVFSMSVMLIGISGAFQKTTRYGFFVYPLLLLLACYGIHRVSAIYPRMQHRVLVLFVVVSFIVLDDYRLFHLATINSDATMYRASFSESKKSHYIGRRDFRSPVEYVNSNRVDEDVVISATTPSDYYLESQLDYMFIPKSANRFWERTVESERGLVDVWSNARLLYTTDSLLNTIKNSPQTVWFIAFAVDWQGQKVDQYRRMFGDQLVYTSIDGTVDLFRIENNNSHE